MTGRVVAQRRAAVAPFFLVFVACMPVAAAKPSGGAQQGPPADAAAGRSLMPARTYSLDDDRAVLKLFDGLRVADVSDGMDAVGLQDVGLMDSKVAPLWRD